MKGENRRSILLVEDEIIIAMAEKMTLEKFGYTIFIATTGAEAVATIEKNPDIDLILMDIDLGSGMDGTEAAAIILARRDLPIVFLSSHVEQEIVDKTEKITSYGYVVKSANDTAIHASIKMAFKLFAANQKEREKELALRKSEALYQALVETSPDSIVLSDTGGAIIMANQRTVELHGYESKQELTGVSAIELFAPVERQRASDNASAAAPAPGVSGNFERLLQRKDGTRFWGELYTKSILSPDDQKPLILTIVRDITERKQAEEALRQNVVRLRHLVESSSDVVWEIDENAITTYVSEKILDRLGYAPEEVIGKRGLDLMPPDEAQKAQAMFRPLFEQRMPFRAIENINLHKNGQRVVMESNGVPIFDHDGVFRGYRGVDRDITDRKRVAEALKKEEGG